MLATCRSGPESVARSPGSSSTTALPSDPVFVTRVHFPGHGGRFAKVVLCPIPTMSSPSRRSRRAERHHRQRPYPAHRSARSAHDRRGDLCGRAATLHDCQRERPPTATSTRARHAITGLSPDHPLGLLLRKHTRGGIILSIDQPPLERLVRLSIAKRQAPLKTRRERLRAGCDRVEA